MTRVTAVDSAKSADLRSEASGHLASKMTTGTMTAVVKAAPAPGSEVRQVPIPSIGARDVLVKVKAASICGTDLHIQNWDKWAQGRIKPPLVFGHEFCGEVVEMGGEVASLRKGDRVVVPFNISCGTCWISDPGAGAVLTTAVIVPVIGAGSPRG